MKTYTIASKVASTETGIEHIIRDTYKTDSVYELALLEYIFVLRDEGLEVKEFIDVAESKEF